MSGLSDPPLTLAPTAHPTNPPCPRLAYALPFPSAPLAPDLVNRGLGFLAIGPAHTDAQTHTHTYTHTAEGAQSQLAHTCDGRKENTRG